ncbi:hypothetical protein RCO48_37760 [Peribacillus frigoritolerans]|nr:hypothetical protein [Peribacillus frigoritolerans]
MTISEMLEKRYNSQTRLISALVSVIYTFMLTVTQVIGMGTILHVLAGWNLTVSMIVGGGIVLFYTILGGMWSVTMTDVVQFVIMTIGIFFIMLPMSISKAGGWGSLKENLPASHFELGNIGGETIFSIFPIIYPRGSCWPRYLAASIHRTNQSRFSWRNHWSGVI